MPDFTLGATAPKIRAVAPCLIQFTVQVIQEVDLVNTRQPGRYLQSSLAYLAEGPLLVDIPLCSLTNRVPHV